LAQVYTVKKSSVVLAKKWETTVSDHSWKWPDSLVYQLESAVGMYLV